MQEQGWFLLSLVWVEITLCWVCVSQVGDCHICVQRWHWGEGEQRWEPGQSSSRNATLKAHRKGAFPWIFTFAVMILLQLVWTSRPKQTLLALASQWSGTATVSRVPLCSFLLVQFKSTQHSVFCIPFAAQCFPVSLGSPAGSFQCLRASLWSHSADRQRGQCPRIPASHGRILH